MNHRIGIRVVAALCSGLAAGISGAEQTARDVVQAHTHEHMPADWAPCMVSDNPPRPDDRGTVKRTTWPGGVVPYEFSVAVNPTNQALARAAMDEIESVCGVRYVPRSGEPAYMLITTDGVTNQSVIGYLGEQAHTVWIASWSVHYIIVHEFFHTLGFYHEHARPDRDDYITINWQNVVPGFEQPFTIVGTMLPFGDYDFLSVMHYPQCNFNTCGCPACPTITVNPPNQSLQTVIGQRNNMSQGDIESLAFLYNGPLIGDDGFEPNNDFASAAQIDAGTHELIMGDEGDYFSFTLADPSDVTLAFGADEPAWRSTMLLLDDQQAVLASVIDHHKRGSDPIEIQLQAGAYAVHIDQELGFHPYELSLTVVGPPRCAGDCDGNGAINIDDIDCFVAAFLANDLGIADCDGNGSINIDDIDCFVASILAGCP